VNKANDTLYCLTVMFTLFIPAQFLSSVYAMDFVDPDTGKPGIPELRWKYGYLYFWVVCAVVVMVTFGSYRSMKWL